MKNIQTIFLLAVISVLLFIGCAKEQSGQNEPTDTDQLGLTAHEEQLEIKGLEAPFEMFFVADTHISLCDDRDPDLKEYMMQRYVGFQNSRGEGSEIAFRDILQYVSGEEPDLLVLGGDILDAATWASVEYLDELLAKLECPWIYEMGNHDFNYGVLNYFSEKSYTEYLPRLQKLSQTTDGYQCVEYDSFVIFAADDAGNQIGKKAVTALEEACKIGKPIILISHVPLEPMEESTLIEDTVKVWGAGWNNYSKVLMGEHANKPNETTKKFMDIVFAEDSNVELVLSGHVHFYHKDDLKGDLQQIITGPGYNKELLKIELVPAKMQ